MLSWLANATGRLCEQLLAVPKSGADVDMHACFGRAFIYTSY